MVRLNLPSPFMNGACINLMKIYDEVSDNRSQIEAERLKKRLFHVQNDVQQTEKQPESVDS